MRAKLWVIDSKATVNRFILMVSLTKSFGIRIEVADDDSDVLVSKYSLLKK